MPRKKDYRPEPLRPSPLDDKYRMLGKAVFDTLDGRSANGLLISAKRNAGFISKLVVALYNALKEIEAIEKRPGHQWQDSNAERSAV